MSITIELFEASGPAKTIELAEQMNWKSISAIDSSYPYWQFPIRRPDTSASEMYRASYVKYVYARISGTYSQAKRVRWVINGIPGLGTKLYYSMTNSYVSPTESLMGSGTLINNGDVLFPSLSSVSPDAATSRVTSLTPPNTTFYTNYLCTQLYVPKGSWMNVGNTTTMIQTEENPDGEPDMTIKLLVDDYE